MTQDVKIITAGPEVHSPTDANHLAVSLNSKFGFPFYKVRPLYFS